MIFLITLVKITFLGKASLTTNQRDFAKKKTPKLLPDPISNTAILVLDKSSIYTRKGLFCKFQRLNYSIHKKPPFVNSFITATYGYIVDEYVVGSFFANGRNNKPLFYHTLRKQMQGIL